MLTGVIVDERLDVVVAECVDFLFHLLRLLTLARAVLERGYVLIDMDSFYVVLSANAFVRFFKSGGRSSLWFILPPSSFIP